MGQAVEVVTPRVILDLFLALSDEQQEEFLRLFAGACSVDAPLFIVSQLPKARQFELSGRMHEQVIKILMPIAIDRAWELLKERPDVPLEQFRTELKDRITKWVEALGEEMAELERDKVTAQRNRKSNPETIRRNIEICDRRKLNPSLWTLGKLAKEYGIKRSTVQGILNDEPKWRQLNAEALGN